MGGDSVLALQGTKCCTGVRAMMSVRCRVPPKMHCTVIAVKTVSFRMQDIIQILNLHFSEILWGVSKLLTVEVSN